MRHAEDMRVRDKVAVVTGGASGIGAAAARLLAREGACVAILDINGEGADRVAAETGGDAWMCDVSDEEQVRGAMARIAHQHGAIHVLFANAGISIRHPVADEDAADWDRLMSINVKGIFLCAKHAIPYMPPGASIIQTSSVTGIVGVRNRALYSASKGAIVALTRNMALDYADRGIRVNCICPGFVLTELIAGILEKDPQRATSIAALHPLGRMGQPDDIANAVVFLASDESSWITGAAIPIDGGFSAGHFQNI
jgi:NAD(P)-dependent dehydrogenase (short-subunit alcohol dehydrogenase family)